MELIFTMQPDELARALAHDGNEMNDDLFKLITNIDDMVGDPMFTERLADHFQRQVRADDKGGRP